MCYDEINRLLKDFCKQHKFTYLYNFFVYYDLIIVIKEKECLQLLDQFLTHHNIKHKSPYYMQDGVECCVECPELYNNLIASLS